MSIKKLNSKMWVLTALIAVISFCLSLSESFSSASAAERVSFQKLSLGNTKGEIQKVFGKPTYVAFGSEKIDLLLENNQTLSDVGISRTATKKEIDASPRKEKDFDEWIFYTSDSTWFLTFDQKSEKLKTVSCYVFDLSKAKNFTCKIHNIKAKDSEQHIRKILNEADDISIDHSTKILTYKKLHMKVFVGSEGVFNIQINEGF